MTRMPDHAAHADHDLVLIAAHAAGDATGADLARATELVATCPECARLHRDLRALSSALAATPAPSRPRDFRIDAGQAEALRRPTGWRRILAPFAGARSSAGPLAASLATLGVAGLLLSGLGSGLSFGLGASRAAATAVPVALEAPAHGAGSNFAVGSPATDTAGGAEAAPTAAAVPGAPSAAASEAAAAAPSAAASAEPPVPAPTAAPSVGGLVPGGISGGSAVSVPAAGSPATPTSDRTAATARPPAPYAAASGAPGATEQALIAPASREPATATPSAPKAASEEGSGPSPLVIGSLLLLLAGVGIGILRLVARRLV
jgi:hypothetical protein